MLFYFQYDVLSTVPQCMSAELTLFMKWAHDIDYKHRDEIPHMYMISNMLKTAIKGNKVKMWLLKSYEICNVWITVI